MQTKSSSKCLALFIALGFLVALWGCNGDNNGSDNNTVQGNVAQVMTAMNNSTTEPAQVAQWTDFLSLIATAHAQGTDLSGITVMATIDGVIVDETATDASGDFILDVGNGGEVMLTFKTDAFEVNITITVPEGSDVTLTVSLQPEDEEAPVVVDEMSVAYHPIRCEGTETVTLSSDMATMDGENAEYVINGDGDTCMRATGQCKIETDFGDNPVHIKFENCDHCIRAEGGATIELFTDGWVSCDEASGDGIRTRGNATVAVEVGEWMKFTPNQTGVDARGNASVVLSLKDQADNQVADDQVADDQADNQADDQAPDAPIWIEGGVHAQGNATVEIEGDCHADITHGGNAAVMGTCEF